MTSSRRRWVILCGLAATAIFATGSLTLPFGSAVRVVWVSTGWVAADAITTVACYLAYRRAAESALRVAWGFFTAGIALSTAGAVVWTWHDLVLHDIAAYPSLTEIFGWMSSCTFLAGLSAYRFDKGSTALTVRQLADLGLLAASLFGIAVEILYPRLQHTPMSAGGVAAAITTPALGMLVLFVSPLTLWQRWLGKRRRVLLLLLAGVAVLNSGCLLYAVALLGGNLRAPYWVDSIWLIGMLFIAWAAVEERWLVGSTHEVSRLGSRVDTLVPALVACTWFATVTFSDDHHLGELMLVRGVALTGMVTAVVFRTLANHKVQLELQRRIAREEARRWRLEADLLQAQKLEALGTLAAGVAHDFNNVLASAMATLQVAKRRMARGGEPSRELSDVEQVLRRATGLTQRLLGLAHHRAQRRRPIDVRETIEHVASLLTKVLPPGVVLHREIGSDLPAISVDPTGLEHALLNLGLNARDALRGRDGTITIAVRCSITTGEVAIEVIDDGPGIPADVLPRVFEPFFTTKPVGEGTGLGLATVEAFASDNGGALAVESVAGEGATFRLRFPSTDQAPVTSALPELRGTVLLVQTGDATGLTTSGALDRCGLVTVAVQGREGALAAARQHGAAIGAVVVDAATGWADAAALRELRGAGLTAPAVLLAAGGVEPSGEWAAVLHKPIAPDELAARVGETLSAADHA